MDNYRKQIAANLRIACPSIALCTHTTEIITTRKGGFKFACVCDSGAPYKMHIMGPAKLTTSEAMSGLLDVTEALMETKLRASMQELQQLSPENCAEGINQGRLARTAVIEEARN